ncbi:MAG: MMPL family transporter, partial [Solirubrobacteraceae bacterium]
MFRRFGRSIVRHPWRVIAVWIVGAFAVVGLAPKLTTTSTEANFLPSRYQSVQAMALQKRDFPTAATPAAIVVFEAANGGPLSATESESVERIAGRLRAEHI